MLNMYIGRYRYCQGYFSGGIYKAGDRYFSGDIHQPAIWSECWLVAGSCGVC
jgi:hypothetical protein